MNQKRSLGANSRCGTRNDRGRPRNALEKSHCSILVGPFSPPLPTQSCSFHFFFCSVLRFMFRSVTAYLTWGFCQCGRCGASGHGLLKKQQREQQRTRATQESIPQHPCTTVMLMQSSKHSRASCRNSYENQRSCAQPCVRCHHCRRLLCCCWRHHQRPLGELTC